MRKLPDKIPGMTKTVGGILEPKTRENNIVVVLEFSLIREISV